MSEIDEKIMQALNTEERRIMETYGSDCCACGISWNCTGFR